MSIDYTLPGDKWAGGLYAIGQEVQSIIDRRAIGAELRYNDETFTAYAAGDYDIFYKELNNAYLNGNWRVRNGTTIYGTVDFRRVPFLVTSNALMGQVEDDLQSLVDVFGLEDVYQLALDRTATAKTASLGISQEITDKWQITLDGMVADYSGTPASGGVDAIPDPASSTMPRCSLAAPMCSTKAIPSISVSAIPIATPETLYGGCLLPLHAE